MFQVEKGALKKDEAIIQTACRRIQENIDELIELQQKKEEAKAERKQSEEPEEDIVEEDDEEEDDKVGVTRFFLAMISLAFAVYMVPGLWGAPLRAISAFAPPAHTQDFVLNKNEMQTHFLDYEEGMAYAKKAAKPVLLDFTGHGCVNCRKMENAVWIDQNVKQIIDNDYVLISLYVDEKLPYPST
jgi:hypothetical protein